VLLPGLDGTGLLFQSLVAALPSTIKPIIVRYPGDRCHAYDELLTLVLNSIPPNEPFILLGESFSGPLAVMLAAQCPANPVGLILCATFVTRPWPIIGPAIHLLARAPLFSCYLPYKRIKARIFGYSTPEHRVLLAEMQRLVCPSVIASRVRMVFRVNVTDALRACRVPILYMQATRDLIVPGRNLRVIQKIRPDIQVVTIDSSHMVLQSHPAEATRAIANFALSIG
jgi:pimeloyl-ACP methyl ester carboxylesterase